jgi:diguanylate cyclase (GGDEF)-like protein
MENRRPIQKYAQCQVALSLWAGAIARGLAVLLIAAALAWLVRGLIVRDPAPGSSWLVTSFFALTNIVVVCWAVAQRRRRWLAPRDKLLEALPELRGGQRAIESLSDVSGGLAPLVPHIQEAFRDLRRQRAAMTRLEHEISQKVASRTDALERELGSLRQKATRDPLTGLYNRRMLDEHLPRVVDRRIADKGAFCLMMIDVDNFKILNDTLGHAAGDELLKSIAQLIRSAIRENDLAFRCGGDEFVVLLDGCEIAPARGLAFRLTGLVDTLGKTLKVVRQPGLSIGISSLAELKEPSTQLLLEAADRNLYEVKNARKRSTSRVA